MNGNIGDPYTTEAKAIAGWTVTKNPTNATGTFGEKAQTVTYVYEKASAAPVTVKYVDKDGNELATPDTLNGNIGDPYTTEAKAIAGWTVTKNPTNATGTFGEKAQTVTYVYEKSVVSMSLTVKDSVIAQNSKWNPSDNFVSATDINGKDIPFEDVVVSGKVDTSKVGLYQVEYTINYETSEEKGATLGFISSIAGDIAYAAEDDNSLSAIATIQVVPNEEDPVQDKTTPSISTTSEEKIAGRKTEGNIVRSFVTKSKDGNYISTDGTTKSLPKTGEKKQTILIPLLGLSIMVTTISGFVISKKRRKL